ncbi:formyltetrahydrofolate deformylase [Flexithrix dorotheae]|uniref:formyltetrahydrofolate deformylase n=1 Tax=Flexithrix dorotheae TaxID=70993 RepID=UPI00037500C8|nr:formyltetrahydrofolate deformylase [Flexithrix dorotheae]
MTKEKNYILLIDCTDEKGLVHKISEILYSHSFNMIGNSEYVDRENNHFFMRTELIGDFSREKLTKELKAVLPEDANINFHRKKKKDIVVLATKEYHCLGDLLVRHHFGDLNANIKAVISNHNTLEDFTKKFDIPYHFISHENLDRNIHENKVAEIIQSYNPEYVILAKYMRILSPDFIARFSNNIINIHHSFLPAFIGANPYKQAYNRGVKIIGATAHFVNNELDEGPIILQDITHVDHKMTAKDMSKAGKDVEKIVLAKALKSVFDDRVFIDGNKTIIFD